MKENNINKFLLITSIVSTTILLIGATFSYFTISAKSKMNALSVEAGRIKLGLGVAQKFTDKKIIPTNDSDIMLAYNQECVDDFGFDACLAYDLEVSNFTDSQEVIGKINFSVENIENLSYMVLDENNNIYLDKTKVNSGTDQSLGDSFSLANGSDVMPTSKKFVLIVWLSNIEEAQESYDAGGKFSASVTYTSIYGDMLTGTINGMQLDTAETAKLGEE